MISKDKALCPLCRGPISHANLVELPPEPDPTDDDEGAAVAGGAGVHSGAKIAALMRTLLAAMASKPEVSSLSSFFFSCLLPACVFIITK